MSLRRVHTRCENHESHRLGLVEYGNMLAWGQAWLLARWVKRFEELLVVAQTAP